MLSIMKFALVPFFLGVLGLSAQAQSTSPPADLLAKTQTHKIVYANGQETFIATPVIALDDSVQYTTDYYNNATSPLYNIRVTFAVPPHMKLVSLTPDPTAVKVRDQANPKAWQSYPVYIKDKGVRATPIGHYTELSWVIPRLEPKKSARVVVRAQLAERPTLPGQ